MSIAYAEQNRPFSAIPPTEVDPFARRTADELTPRNCVYVGGPAELDLSPLIGESYVQHSTVRRRVLTLFTEHPVGMKDESPEAEMAYLSAGPDSDPVPKRRTRMKSPKEDAYQIFKTYGEEGFTICESLLGLVEVAQGPDGRKSYDNSKAEAVYAAVVPYEFMTGGTLKNFRDHLQRHAQRRIAESSLTPELQARAERLRLELLASTVKSLTLWAKHVGSLAGEWDRYRNGEGGKADFNDAEKELFREVGRPLPEERQANANKAVVETVIEATGGQGSNDALVRELLARDAARARELEEMRGLLTKQQSEAPAQTQTRPRKGRQSAS